MRNVNREMKRNTLKATWCFGDVVVLHGCASMTLGSDFKEIKDVVREQLWVPLNSITRANLTRTVNDTIQEQMKK